MTGDQPVKKVVHYYPKASIGKRIWAYVIDSLIGGVPLLIFGAVAVFTLIGHINTYGDFSLSNIETLIILGVFLLFSFLWAFFYTLLRDGFGEGQSWGKKTFGLMVVNLDGYTPCGMAKSFVRNIFAWIISVALSWIPALNVIAGFAEPIVAIIHEKGQRVGDMVGNTQVVEVEHYRERFFAPRPADWEK